MLTLKTKLLISTFMIPIYFNVFQPQYSLWFLSSSRSCTLISSLFIKLYLSSMSALSSSTCLTNYIISSMWRQSSKSAFSACFSDFKWYGCFHPSQFGNHILCVSPHILLGLNQLLLVPIKYLVLLIQGIFKMENSILCSLSYHIDYTLN